MRSSTVEVTTTMPEWLTIELGVLAIVVPLLVAYGGYLRHEFRSLKQKDDQQQQEFSRAIADLRVEIEKRVTRADMGELYTKIDTVETKVDQIWGRLEASTTK